MLRFGSLPPAHEVAHLARGLVDVVGCVGGGEPRAEAFERSARVPQVKQLRRFLVGLCVERRAIDFELSAGAEQLPPVQHFRPEPEHRRQHPSFADRLQKAGVVHGYIFGPFFPP